jgi:molybdopterin-guanine dinucleotide biosynthesis protein A
MTGRPVLAPVRVGGIAGLILAGGAGRRMGEGPPKPLRRLAGRPLLAHVIERVRPQVMALAIGSGDAVSYAGFGLPLLPDPPAALPHEAGRAGPLAGVLAGLEWVAHQHLHCRWLLTVPADAPFLPANLMARMAGHLHVDEPEVLVLRHAGRLHPTIAVWSVRLVDDLRHALRVEGLRRMDTFVERHPHRLLDWPRGGPDPFFNVNTPADLARAERRLAGALPAGAER